MSAAARKVSDDDDLARAVIEFWPTAWGVRPLASTCRRFMGLIRAELRRGLWLLNHLAFRRVCVATGRVEALEQQLSEMRAEIAALRETARSRLESQVEAELSEQLSGTDN